MSNDNNRVVIVEHHHHIIAKELRPLTSQQRVESKEKKKEQDKWCCTRIQEARKRNANDTRKCFSEVLQILLESCFAVVFFVIENLIGIVFLILGIIFLNDCPISPAIPISLIVYGIFSMIHGITIQIIRWKYVDPNNQNDGFATCASLIILVASIIHLIALFIACLLVFHLYDKVKTGKGDKTSDHYCHPFLYWFSFYFFLFMAIMGLIIIMIFCCLCCFILSGAVPDSPPPNFIVVHQTKSGNQSNTNTDPSANPQMTAQQSNADQSSTAPPPTA